MAANEPANLLTHRKPTSNQTALHPTNRFFTEGSKTSDHCHPDSNPAPLNLQSSPPSSSSSSNEFSTTSSRRVPQLAGRFGASGAGCDSPLALINETLRFVAEKLNGLPEGSWRVYNDGGFGMEEEEWRKMEEGRREGLDFVVWTGDSARHDNDARFVRTEAEIQALNHLAVTYMLRTFPSPSPNVPSLPIIPTIGNNDIWPHNSMTYTPTRPNPTLDYYAALWEPFLPPTQLPTFRLHGSFWVEVIPNVIVVSINTMYLSNSNDLVRDCQGPKGVEKEGRGGDAVLEFLKEVLGMARKEGWGVHVVGHVPPNPLNFWEGCYRGFSKLAMEFRDVVVGQHYGHMNVDHFFFPTLHDGVGEKFALSPSSLPASSSSSSDDLFSTLKSTLPSFSTQNTPITTLVPGWFSMYFHYLMTHYHAESKRKSDKIVQPIFVAPSVVPNMNPAVRVFEYNAGLNTYSGDPTEKGDSRVDLSDISYVAKRGALLGYTQYYSDISKWNQLYSLSLSSSASSERFPPEGVYIYEKEYRPNKSYKLVPGEGLGGESWREFAGRVSEAGKRGEKLREKLVRNMVVGVKGVKVGSGKGKKGKV